MNRVKTCIFRIMAGSFAAAFASILGRWAFGIETMDASYFIGVSAVLAAVVVVNWVRRAGL